MSNPVIIVPYDPAWPAHFAAERAAILAAVGEQLLALEHMGSTAVPGLAAKPIIDLAGGLRALDDALPCIEPLRALGYEYVPEYEAAMPDRRYFRKRPVPGGAATHHLHMWVLDSEPWQRHLRFRDILRAHPDLAAAYGALKQRLATQYGEDREGYTDAKSEFVERLLREHG